MLILLGDQIYEDAMGGARSTYLEDEWIKILARNPEAKKVLQMAG
jgi:hypothetical protein